MLIDRQAAEYSSQCCRPGRKGALPRLEGGGYTSRWVYRGSLIKEINLYVLTKQLKAQVQGNYANTDLVHIASRNQMR